MTSALCIAIVFSSAIEINDDETSSQRAVREYAKTAALEIVRLESMTEKPQPRPFVLYTFVDISGIFGDSTHALRVVSGDALIDLEVHFRQVSTNAGAKWTSGDVMVVRGSCKNREFLGNGLVVLGGFGSVLWFRTELVHADLIIAQLNRSDALQRVIMRNCPEPIVSANLAPFTVAREKYLKFRREIEPAEPLRAESDHIGRSACIFTERYPGQQPTRFYIQRSVNLGPSIALHPSIEIYRLPSLRDEAEQIDLTLRACSLTSCLVETPSHGEEQPIEELASHFRIENGRYLRTTLTSDNWCRELDSNIPYTFQRIFETGRPLR